MDSTFEMIGISLKRFTTKLKRIVLKIFAVFSLLDERNFCKRCSDGHRLKVDQQERERIETQINSSKKSQIRRKKMNEKLKFSTEQK